MERVLALVVMIALGTLPLMGFVSQAAVSPTQILDSVADISRYDIAGDYIVYINTPVSGDPQEVKLFNYKTGTTTIVHEGCNTTYHVATNGNKVIYTNATARLNPDLMMYDIASGASTLIDTFVSYYSFGVAMGPTHYAYAKVVNSNTTLTVKTMTGNTVYTWNSADSFFGLNINNGFVMWSTGDAVHAYNIATDSHFTISVASGGFADNVDTDGTTIIFSEGGSYPNEYTRLVTYNIASKSRNAFNVPNSAGTFRIDSGKIFYIDTQNLYWMNIGGSGVEKISDSAVQAGYLNIENGKAVVKNPDDWSILHMYDTAGMGGGTILPGNVIGTLGGTVNVTGARMVVPAGSLDSDVEFEINERTVISEGILAAFDILPNDIIFDPAATLTLDIPGTRAAGNELMRLENGQWVAVTSTPSNDGNSLIVQITQTGTYAISLARDTVQQVIGTAGGTLTLPDVTLNIPVNALASTATVALEEIFVEGANVAQAIAVNLGGAVLSIPAQLNFDIPATMDQATAQVGQLVGTSWIAVESALNSAGQLVADITEGGIYALLSVTGGDGGIIDIPFPSGAAVLAVLLTTGLAMAVVQRRRRK